MSSLVWLVSPHIPQLQRTVTRQAVVVAAAAADGELWTEMRRSIWVTRAA